MKKKNMMASALLFAMLVAGCSGGGSETSSSQASSQSESASSQVSSTEESSSEGSEKSESSGESTSTSDSESSGQISDSKSESESSSESKPASIEDVIAAADEYFEKAKNGEIESISGRLEISGAQHENQYFSFEKKTRRGFHTCGQSQQNYLIPNKNEQLMETHYAFDGSYAYGNIISLKEASKSCCPFNIETLYDLVKSFNVTQTGTAKMVPALAAIYGNDNDRTGPDAFRNIVVERAESRFVEGNLIPTAAYQFEVSYTQRHIDNPYGSYYYQKESFRQRTLDAQITVSAQDGMLYGMSLVAYLDNNYSQPVTYLLEMNEEFDEQTYNNYGFPEITSNPSKGMCNIDFIYDDLPVSVDYNDAVGAPFGQSELEALINNEYYLSPFDVKGVYLDEEMTQPFEPYDVLTEGKLTYYLDATIKDGYSIIEKINNYKQETDLMLIVEFNEEEEQALFDALPYERSYIIPSQIGWKQSLYDGLNYEFERDQKVYVNDELMHAKSFTVSESVYKVKTEGRYYYGLGSAYRPHFARDIRRMSVIEENDGFFVKYTPRYSDYQCFFILPREIIKEKGLQITATTYISDYVFTSEEQIDYSKLQEPAKSYWFTSTYGYYDDNGNYNKVKYDEVGNIDEKYDILISIGSSSSFDYDSSFNYKQIYFKIY